MSGRLVTPNSLEAALTVDGLDCDESVFQQSEWKFQPAAVTVLFDRLMGVGSPLSEVAQGSLYRGLLTGLNEAFIVDDQTRNRLIAEDENCKPLLRKMLRGEDFRPWYFEDEGRWLILIPSSSDRVWPWSKSSVNAEDVFQATYPSLYRHFVIYKDQLIKRQDKGLYWWELRACAYYGTFDQPKIFWPEIAKLPRFSLDQEGCLMNNKGYMIAGAQWWLLGILHSRIIWFCISQICTPLRLRGGLWQYQCFKQFMERLPIPTLQDADKKDLSGLATRITDLAKHRYHHHQTVRQRICSDLGKGAVELSQRLQAWWQLDFASLRKEVKAAFRVDIPVAERSDWEAALETWREQHRQLTRKIVALESQLNDRVCRLFDVSASELRLLDDHGRQAMIGYPFGEP